jgi:anti-anti-sigma regulatory factor
MGIRNLSEDVILVTLPKEPQMGKELRAVNEMASGEGLWDVIIDFSMVEIITSSNISNLLILHRSLQNAGRRLILCNVALPTRCIFKVAGLDGLLEFADDKFGALATMRMAVQTS